MVCVPETTIGFQLPLSGSLRLLLITGKGKSRFQLPLSGSLYEKFREWPDKIAEVRAFNSLSRDHTKAGRLIDVVDHFPFNSLSRDHSLATGEIGRGEGLMPRTFNSLSRDHNG